MNAVRSSSAGKRGEKKKSSLIKGLNDEEPDAHTFIFVIFIYRNNPVRQTEQMTQESSAWRAEKRSRGLSVLTLQLGQKKRSLTHGDRELLHGQNFSGNPGRLLSCLALPVLCVLSRVNTPNPSPLSASVTLS